MVGDYADIYFIFSESFDTVSGYRLRMKMKIFGISKKKKNEILCDIFDR